MATTRKGAQAGVDARERILVAALSLFAAHGLHGTTLAAIAEQAGLTRAGVLHHFASKRDVLIAVFEDQSRRSLLAWTPEGASFPRSLNDIDLDRPEFDAVDIERALDVVNEVARENEKNRALVLLAHLCALEPAGKDPVAAQWSAARQSRVRRMIASAVRHSLTHGTARSDANPDMIGAFVVAAFEGFESQWLLDPSFDLPGATEAFTSMLRRDLRIAAELPDS